MSLLLTMLTALLLSPAHAEDRSVPVDTDGDGLWDEEEVWWGTDPDLADTDGDGFWDGEEVWWGTDPLVRDADSAQPLPGEDVSPGPQPPFDPTEISGHYEGDTKVDHNITLSSKP